jgi:hypothetical protein
VNGINANQLRRWINEYKFDPVRFDRRLSGGAVAKGRKANSQPALMLPVDLTNMPAIPVLPASQAPGLISPRMVDVELARGRVRLHGVDAAMLATVFNLLNAD